MDAHRTVPQRRRQLARSMRRRMTPPEFRLWLALKAHRLERLGFRRQVPVGRYVVDFLCPSARLVIEVDGPQHLSDAAEAADAIRTEWLANAGYHVMRFSSLDVMHELDGVCSTILGAVVERVPGFGEMRPPED